MAEWKQVVVLSILCGLKAFAAGSEPGLELINNQPFSIQMPVEVRQFILGDANWVTGEGQPVQQHHSNLVFVAQIDANKQKHLSFRQGSAQKKSGLILRPAEHGLALAWAGNELGQLTWDLVVREVKRKRADAEDNESTRRDFDAEFNPLQLSFRKTAQGPVFDTWSAEAVKDGLKLRFELRVFHEGFLDLNASLTNETSTHTSNVYAAVVCRWDQPQVESRSLCYDNRISPLGERAWSPFREGEGRHLFVQRGVDWIRAAFKGGLAVAWLNDFAPSFTVRSAATAKTPAHYTGANLPQLGQEAQTTNQRLYSITEIARASIKSYRDRLKENILPPRGQGVSFASRIVFGGKDIDDKKADQMFVGWTSFNQCLASTSAPRELVFGVRSVRFGTSYFPYSTLGENFDAWKLPGMDRESFWPLAADTVNQWRLFADDIRRDLRLARAMGFQLIRLHHLELLAPIEKKAREEYLDFLFGELRHLQLKALLDVYASPEQLADLLKRYGDVVDTVEIENEVLIWGIPLDRPAYWNEIYTAVKKAAPHVRVHLTGYNNTGMFDRLADLNVRLDRVGLHSYIDSLEAIPSGRGYALALASYASKADKGPVITEWNWRGLTRMTEQERAKVYPHIIEGAIGTRGIQDFYQFQFNETLCPNPRVGRGNILRHYELLHLSRRPKAEAIVLMDLIRKYSAPEDALRALNVTFPIVHLGEKTHGHADLRISNTSTQALDLRVTLEAPAGLQAKLNGDGRLKLAPGTGVLRSEPLPVGQVAGPWETILSVELTLTNAQPGFYYCFARIESDRGWLRYAVIEAQKQGPPKFASDEPKLDWSKPITVVYGQEAPVLEVETAIAIAETLECATGQPVEALQLQDLPKSAVKEGNLILVGTPKSNTAIEELKVERKNEKGGLVLGAESPTAKPCLVVSGADSAEVEKAGMGFILTYWKNAKDSAARRVGLVEKELPRGVDAAKLP